MFLCGMTLNNLIEFHWGWFISYVIYHRVLNETSIRKTVDVTNIKSKQNNIWNILIEYHITYLFIFLKSKSKSVYYRITWIWYIYLRDWTPVVLGIPYWYSMLKTYVACCENTCLYLQLFGEHYIKIQKVFIGCHHLLYYMNIVPFI